MGTPRSLKGYYIYCVFTFFNGFGGSVWGAMTFYIGIPVLYLTHLKASSLQIGLVTAIFWAGLAVPQFWAAFLSEFRAVKKYFIGTVILVSSITWGIMGCYILFTGDTMPAVSIWLFLGLYTVACSVKAFDVPANSALCFKIMPTERIGQLSGIASSIQYSGIVIAGFVIAFINRSLAKPYNFAALFLATFVISVLIAVIMFMLDEPPNETSGRSESLGHYFGKLRRIVISDKIFIRFIVGKWLMSGNQVILAFFLVYLIKRKGLDMVTAGWFSSFFAIGSIIAGFTVAKLVDIYGPRFMLLLSQVFTLIYISLALFTPNLPTFIVLLAFIVCGLASAADWSGLGYMMYLCSPDEDKSSYVALTFIGSNLFTVPLPMIVGKLIDKGILGYHSSFTIFIATTIAAIIYIMTVVRNPEAFIKLKNARQVSG